MITAISNTIPAMPRKTKNPSAREIAMIIIPPIATRTLARGLPAENCRCRNCLFKRYTLYSDLRVPKPSDHGTHVSTPSPEGSKYCRTRPPNNGDQRAGATRLCRSPNSLSHIDRHHFIEITTTIAHNHLFLLTLLNMGFPTNHSPNAILIIRCMNSWSRHGVPTQHIQRSARELLK